MQRTLTLSTLPFALLFSAAAYAQTDAAAEKAKAEANAKDQVTIATDGLKALKAKTDKKGLELGLKLGGTGSFLQNQNFVGQTDGVTLQFGVLVAAKANMSIGQHEWRNNLVFEHAQLKAPNLELFVKSVDALEFKSLYLWRVPDMEWVGPFGRFRAFTQVFPGAIVRANDTTVLQKNLDGSVSRRNIAAQTPIELTSGFEPLVLEQSVGVFVEPIASGVLTLDARAGVGAQEVLTNGGFATADDVTTPELEITALATVFSAGVEAEVGARGVFIKDVLSWSLTANTYYPVLVNDTRGLEGADLLHYGFIAGATLKLSQWASLDYALKIVKQPFVLDEVQFQNAVLVSTSFDFL